MRFRIPVLCALSLLASAASAAIYDEAVEGDLSTDPGNPTSIVVEEGINVVIGSVETPDDTRDYFTFSVGAGQLLTGIFLNNYVDLDGAAQGNRGFIHIDDGTSSVVPSAATIGDFLGGSHLDRTIFPDDTTNVLTRLASASEGGVGFTAPLGAGDYTINVQQTGPQSTGYEIALNISAIPEPNMAFALGTVSLIGAVARRRRS